MDLYFPLFILLLRTFPVFTWTLFLFVISCNSCLPIVSMFRIIHVKHVSRVGKQSWSQIYSYSQSRKRCYPRSCDIHGRKCGGYGSMCTGSKLTFGGLPHTVAAVLSVCQCRILPWCDNILLRVQRLNKLGWDGLWLQALEFTTLFGIFTSYPFLKRGTT